jgi:hypothetical protein
VPTAPHPAANCFSHLFGGRFVVPNHAGGLGDWLSLTPTLRAARDAGLNPLVLAPDSPHTREFATLYAGLAEVEFLPAGHPSLIATPETDEPTCFSLRIMRAHGLTGSPIPYIEGEPHELLAATSLLSHFCAPSKMVAIAPSPGAARADLPDSHIANYRRWPEALRDRLIERLHSQGLQPVRFGTKATQQHIYQNHAEWPGVLTIPDLNVRQLAACYAVIGRGVMTDTADRHLLIATGGVVDLWVPQPTWFYDHAKTLYGADAWAAAGEEPRERHHVYAREMPTILQ